MYVLPREAGRDRANGYREEFGFNGDDTNVEVENERLGFGGDSDEDASGELVLGRRGDSTDGNPGDRGDPRSSGVEREAGVPEREMSCSS